MTDRRPTEEAGAASSPPVLRVVKGDPTPEQLAALVAVLAATGGGGSPAPRRTPAWSTPRRRLRQPLAHGPGAWRSSTLPR